MWLHLNLYDAEGDAPDEEGAEYADLEAARMTARRGICSLLSSEVLLGQLNLAGRCEITDSDGEILDTLTFADVLAITHPGVDS